MWFEHLATVQRNQKQGAEKAAAAWRQQPHGGSSRTEAKETTKQAIGAGDKLLLQRLW